MMKDLCLYISTKFQSCRACQSRKFHARRVEGDKKILNFGAVHKINNKTFITIVIKTFKNPVLHKIQPLSLYCPLTYVRNH